MITQMYLDDILNLDFFFLLKNHVLTMLIHSGCYSLLKTEGSTVLSTLHLSIHEIITTK